MPQAALKGGCVPGEDGPARAGADEDHSWRCSVDACRRDAGSAPPFAMESGSASVGCRRASLKRAARWRSVAVQAVDAAYQRLRRSRTFATRRAGSRRRKGSSSARQKWCFSTLATLFGSATSAAECMELASDGSAAAFHRGATGADRALADVGLWARASALRSSHETTASRRDSALGA